MKVLHRMLAALIAGILLPSPPVVGRDGALPPRVRGRQGSSRRRVAAAAAAVEYALPENEGGEIEAEGGRGRRKATTASSFGPLSCTKAHHLHFCMASLFVNADRCEESSNAIVDAGGQVEPMVLVLAHLKECASEIGTVKFDLMKDGVRMRRFAEREWPYTVLGDTTSPFTVNSRVFGPGRYTVTVDIKDPTGCLLETQNYDFTIRSC